MKIGAEAGVAVVVVVVVGEVRRVRRRPRMARELARESIVAVRWKSQSGKESNWIR